MTIAVILLACLGLPFAFNLGQMHGRYFERMRRLPPKAPVNVIGSVILPEPDDPRWRRGKRRCNHGGSCKFRLLSLGHVQVCAWHGTWVGGVAIPECAGDKAYAAAVVAGYQAQKALVAVTS